MLWKELAPIPYGYTREDVDLLPEANIMEVELWSTGKRINALQLYQSRSPIKDVKLIAWYFWTMSSIVKNLRHRSRIPGTTNAYIIGPTGSTIID